MPRSRRDIGRAIRAARKAAGLTQQQLADLAGVGARSTLANIEAGRQALTVEALYAIAVALGVPAAHLLGEESPATEGGRMEARHRLIAGQVKRTLERLAQLTRECRALEKMLKTGGGR